MIDFLLDFLTAVAAVLGGINILVAAAIIYYWKVEDQESDQ